MKTPCQWQLLCLTDFQLRKCLNCDHNTKETGHLCLIWRWRINEIKLKSENENLICWLGSFESRGLKEPHKNPATRPRGWGIQAPTLPTERVCLRQKLPSSGNFHFQDELLPWGNNSHGKTAQCRLHTASWEATQCLNEDVSSQAYFFFCTLLEYNSRFGSKIKPKTSDDL